MGGIDAFNIIVTNFWIIKRADIIFNSYLNDKASLFSCFLRTPVCKQSNEMGQDSGWGFELSTEHLMA